MYGGVLAAGQGTRMRPLTDDRPKPLLPAAGRPLLEHAFDAALDVVDEFVVVVGYRREDVNLRHDDVSVRMTVKRERVDTGRRKLGMVFGHGVKTGINVSLNAGVKDRSGVGIDLGETVLRDVEEY